MQGTKIAAFLLTAFLTLLPLESVKALEQQTTDAPERTDSIVLADRRIRSIRQGHQGSRFRVRSGIRQKQIRQPTIRRRQIRRYQQPIRRHPVQKQQHRSILDGRRIRRHPIQRQQIRYLR